MSGLAGDVRVGTPRRYGWRKVLLCYIVSLGNPVAKQFIDKLKYSTLDGKKTKKKT